MRPNPFYGERHRCEIENQSGIHPECLHVGADNCKVNGIQPIHRLEFHNKGGIHKEIQAMLPNAFSPVFDIQGFLPLKLDASLEKLNTQSLLVKGF